MRRKVEQKRKTREEKGKDERKETQLKRKKERAVKEGDGRKCNN